MNSSKLSPGCGWDLKCTPAGQVAALGVPPSIATPIGIPDEFDLIVDSDQTPRRCRTNRCPQKGQAGNYVICATPQCCRRRFHKV